MSKTRPWQNMNLMVGGIFILATITTGLNDLYMTLTWLFLGLAYLVIPPTESERWFKPWRELTWRDWLAGVLLVAALVTFGAEIFTAIGSR